MSATDCSPKEVWEYVNGLERLGTHLGLERVTKRVEALGSPHKAYRLSVQPDRNDGVLH